MRANEHLKKTRIQNTIQITFSTLSMSKLLLSYLWNKLGFMVVDWTLQLGSSRGKGKTKRIIIIKQTIIPFTFSYITNMRTFHVTEKKGEINE